MGTRGRLETHWIISFEEEVVVASRIRSDARIVVDGTEREWRATAPSAHHLCCQQLFFFGTFGVSPQILSKLRHALMKFAEHDVGSVSSQNFRNGLLGSAQLIGIPDYKLSGF